MSRSGYDDGYECDDLDALLAAGRWRAQLHSAMRGKRGRALLHDLIAALDATPEKRRQTVRDWAQRELERMGREHERKVQR